MIWLIGNKGMLGQELSHILADRTIEFIGTDREVDIRDPCALRAFANGRRIHWIVNCSAYTAVDKAEDEEEIARAINAAGAGNIALVAHEIGAKVIHISTDYVFKGDGDTPYLENDPIAPQGAYGRTKAEGEALVASNCPRHFILRTAWLYGKYGPNFVATMLRLMNERPTLSVVSDQHGTPTWAYDLAMAIGHIIRSDSEKFGIYHFTDAGQTTWYGFASEIQRQGRALGILTHDCRVDPISSDQYPSKVKRPSWSVLSKDKIIRELNVSLPQWEDSLKKYLEEKLS